MSAIIALLPPPEVAGLIALADGEPADRLHLTLAYLLEDETVIAGRLAELHATVAGLADQWPKLDAEIGGIGRFNTVQDDGTEPFYASVDCPLLPAFRQALVERLNLAGFPVSELHGFVPHITLSYLPLESDFPLVNLEKVPFRFEGVTTCVGPEWTTFPFGDAGGEEPAMPAVLTDDAAQLHLAYVGELAGVGLYQAEEVATGLYRITDGARVTYLAKHADPDQGPATELLLILEAGAPYGIGERFAASFADPTAFAKDATAADWEQAVIALDHPAPPVDPLEPITKGRYRVLKSEDVRRYTLGVAYPANEVDVHGQYMSAETVEQMCWSFPMVPEAIGLMHVDGEGGHGYPVEKYIYRGPDWDVGDGQVVKNGDFVLGVVWDELAWSLILTGQLVGFSIQGYAEVRRPNGD